MTLSIGTQIFSNRNHRIVGTVVGYGALSWPTGADTNGDGGIMQPVYLVQVAEASSSLGPACAVLRADQVEEVVG